MQHKTINNAHIIRLEKGEEIIDCLKSFCIQNKIKAGYFFGIGAASSAEIAIYQLNEKKYLTKDFNQTLEVINLTGNISFFENELIIHCHSLLATDTFECVGGHLNKAVVAATIEIILHPFNGRLERIFDSDIGLKLLNLK